ncbi:neuropeptide F receptor-like isoform X1 [Ornithodoros turicata]|uniref:neuropeptide F receptor-like isoform X1 n=2 Tax=Ornithodoros turicata TaxID=34597 RepID=UPI00313A29C6
MEEPLPRPTFLLDVENGSYEYPSSNASDNSTLDINQLLIQKYQQYLNIRAISEEALAGLLVAYAVLILTGATGNGLVCVAVARKPQMRTARNVFIINLAISDLILCLFTMPFSLVEIVLKFWPLDSVTCKLVSGLQATSIFVSTISITAIALDRYTVIVYPTQEHCKPVSAVLTLSCIWLIALLLSTPLFVYRLVDRQNLPNVGSLRAELRLESVEYCIEKWPIQHGRFFYSVFSMVFQYVLPILIVSVAYARICQKLKYRMVAKGTKLQEKQQRDQKRMQKTNILLISITLIFGISWLPLHILNIVADVAPSIFASNAQFRILFACCHMVSMSSACSNPLLYGWLNDNFRKEFKEIFASCCGSAALRRRTSNNELVVLYTRNHAQSEATCLADTNCLEHKGDKYDTLVISAPE